MAGDSESRKKPGRPLGPAGDIVRRNIARCRGRMPVTELSARLRELGRDIPPLGIRRIEDGSRRVDVDDLVTIAVALEVSPMTLLAPASAEAWEPVSYTALDSPVASEDLLDWLMGRLPLPNTTTVLEFYARALPLWMRDGMINALRKTNRDFPPSSNELREYWGTDGDNK